MLTLLAEIKGLLFIGVHVGIAFALVWLALHQFNRFFGGTK